MEVTDGKFKITFTSNVENPQINAIEILPQSAAGPVARDAGRPAVQKTKASSASRPAPPHRFTDSAGNVWKAEEGFEGGSTIERPDIAIANTKDAGLYRSEHYSMDSFSCAVPNGKYIARSALCRDLRRHHGRGPAGLLLQRPGPRVQGL